MSDTPQMYLAATPHSSSQLALGRCACPDGASLTTVGSVLVDAVGTLLIQSKGTFTAQTSAAMSWLSAATTQCHSQAKVEVYAGGGIAPGPCGAGAPASTPPPTSPAHTSEKLVNAALLAASLGRAVTELGEAHHAAEQVAVGADMAKEVTEVASEWVPEEHKEGLEHAAGRAELVSGAAEIASGNVVGGLATMASGGAAASGGGSNLEERAATDVKMVAGKKISGTAGVGFDFKTINKFGVTAALVTDFTTIKWVAFCLLKFEVKSFVQVKVGTGLFGLHAHTSASMEGKALLTFKAPYIRYKAKMEMTKTLLVIKETVLRNTLEVAKDASLRAKLDIKKDLVIKQKVEIKANAIIKHDLKNNKRKQINKDLTQMAKATLA
jgi:hypothetical protein